MDTPNSVCEEKTYNEVFNLNSETIRNYLYYQCGDFGQAEDITQEAFIKLWHNCAKVPFEKARAFLFSVAKNTFYNQVAHKKVVLEYAKSKNTNRSNKEDPEFLLEEKEFMVKLQSAIAELPEGQRETFLLNRIDKKSYREIAELTGVSIKAVEKKMHKALKKLRETIKNI